MYKIEKGIEIPTATSKFPLYNLEVGDSFFVEEKKMASLRSCASKWNKKNAPEQLTVRKVKGGVRVWRIK